MKQGNGEGHSDKHDAVDADSPLALFPSERQLVLVSSSPRATSFSPPVDFPDEWKSPAGHPTTVAPAATARPSSSVLARAAAFLAVMIAAGTVLYFGVPAFSTGDVQRGIQGGVIVPEEALDALDRHLAALPPVLPVPSPVGSAVVAEAVNQGVVEPPPLEPLRPQVVATLPARSAEATDSRPRARTASGETPRASAARAEPTPRPVFQGTINVDTQPPGARVFVDGRFVDVTPIANLTLRAGSHVVRIELEAYERWSTAVQVVAEKTVNVAATLQPVRQDPGNPAEVQSASDASR
jgi:hypothetical protein